MFWEVLSTFVGTAGALLKGNAQTKAAVFNSNISKYNAGVTRQMGVIEENNVRRNAARQIGSMVANAGASGFDISSIEDSLSDSIYQANYDALATRYNYQARARAFDMESSMYATVAKDSRLATYVGGASALLKGGTQIYKNNTTYGAGSTPFRLGGGNNPNKIIRDN